MAGFTGSVTFLRGVNKSRVPLFRVTSLGTLTTFVGHIETYTASAISRCSVTEIASNPLQAYQDSAYIGYYAVFRFVNPTPAEGENPRREFQLRDPLEILFELVEGERVIKQTYGDQMAAWYSAASGINYNFDKGWLWAG